MFASEHFARQRNVTQSEINQTECYMRKLTFGTTFFVALVAASVASAQGTVRGAQDGAEAGGQAAGPVGAVVGGSVGAATGTVGGILGVPPTTPAPDAIQSPAQLGGRTAHCRPPDRRCWSVRFERIWFPGAQPHLPSVRRTPSKCGF